MIDIHRARKSDRLMKALTGLTVDEFSGLVRSFSCHLKTTFTTVRKVNPALGKPPTLKTAEDKLFYILFYLKSYPIFDLAAWIFGVDGSTCCRWTHWYMEALQRTLQKKLVLPKRKLRTAAELFRMCPDLEAVFIDGTERPRRRPQDPEEQKAYYSGKKKRHTVKNLVITTADREVLVLSPTREGKAHDYGMFKDGGMGSVLPEELPVGVDLGFQGIKKDFPHLTVVMPKKKPKGRELLKKDKRRNKKISSLRVTVEHAIGGVKRFGIVSDIYRNLKAGFDDTVMEVACGLWNYHLKKA